MRTILVCVAICVAAPASADDPARAPITLPQALAAVANAPGALVGSHELAAAEANVDAAGAWPSPSVHVETNWLTARVVAGTTVPLPIFGTVGATKRSAAAERDVMRAEVELVRRELRYQVVQRWVRLARADGEVTSSAIAAQQAAELEIIAKGRLAAGVGADVDVTVAGAARARANVGVTVARREEDAASAALAGVLGWDPTQHLRADGGLVTAPSISGPSINALDALRARLKAHPERTIAERRILAALANVDATRAQGRPMLALEGQIAFDDPTNEHKTDAMLGVAVELPVFAHTGDRTRAARALADAQRARLVVTENALDAGLVEAYRSWQAASEKLQALERDVLPATERAAAMSASAYREGARDLASALQAERELAAVRAERNDALADAAAAYANLQLAVGLEVGNAN